MAQLYEYEGKKYSLPDGLTQDQAIAKIEDHLGIEKTGLIESAGAGIV